MYQKISARTETEGRNRKKKYLERYIDLGARLLGVACAVCIMGLAGMFCWRIVQTRGKQRTVDLVPTLETDQGGSGIINKPLSTEAEGQMLQRVMESEGITANEKPEKENENDWKLILVNPWHVIPEHYSIQVVELVNGQSIDARCYPELQEMMDDCRAAGLSPYICSSYRTIEKQKQLFENNVSALMSQGYSEEAARIETAKNVAFPGTSEHQLGLAVDIVDKNYQVLDEAQEDTAVQKWLMENSWRYGFILRYPTDKSEITGIVYEPWHYRYVGKEAAEAIYNEGICLEEYLNSWN